MDSEKMTRVMDMMKVRIRFHTEIQNHKYLLEDPDFQTELAKKFLGKITQSELVNKTILTDLHVLIKQQLSVDNFDGLKVNTICAEYLAKALEDPSCKYKGEDVFFLVRFALSGNPVGAPIGDIADVIGLQSVLERIQQAAALFDLII